jgi:hypothetical protein
MILSRVLLPAPFTPTNGNLVAAGDLEAHALEDQIGAVIF